MENAFQEFVESWSVDSYATGINKLISCWQNVLIVKIPILINKHVFKPSCNHLKFRIWNLNYFCTNPFCFPQMGLPGSSAGSSAGKNLQCRRPQFDSWVRKIHWRRDRLPIPVFLGFPGGSAGKESAYNAGDLGWIPGLGRSAGEGYGYPLQYSDLENSMDCIVHGVVESRTWLNNFHFQFLSKMGT